MFISPAWAEAASEASKESSFLVSVLPLLIIFTFFYLLVLRPQSKKIAAHQSMLKTLKGGEKVVTAGGLYATVVKVSDHDVTLEIAPNVHVKAQKHTISTLQDPLVPANDMPKGK
jgi:preprotein translocase subunit YajC